MSIRVGITMRVVNAVRYFEPRDSISHDWIGLLIENDLEFVLIPNCGDQVSKFLQLIEYLILLGCQYLLKIFYCKSF